MIKGRVVVVGSSWWLFKSWRRLIGQSDVNARFVPPCATHGDNFANAKSHLRARHRFQGWREREREISLEKGGTSSSGVLSKEPFGSFHPSLLPLRAFPSLTLLPLLSPIPSFHGWRRRGGEEDESETFSSSSSCSSFSSSSQDVLIYIPWKRDKTMGPGVTR